MFDQDDIDSGHKLIRACILFLSRLFQSKCGLKEKVGPLLVDWDNRFHIALKKKIVVG